MPTVPELPEVETVRRGFEAGCRRGSPASSGGRICGFRFRSFAERLIGNASGARRRAKYLTADLDGAEVLVMHLGMSGLSASSKPAGQSRCRRENSARSCHVRPSDRARIVYNDPRRFGFMQRPAPNRRTLFNNTEQNARHAFDGAALARLLLEDNALKLRSDQALIGLGTRCREAARHSTSPAALPEASRKDGTPGAGASGPRHAWFE
jgi:formamidopyrimidine-DNA glycosylase